MKAHQPNITKGFTLVELLVVISIIAALAGLAMPVIMSQRKKAYIAEATSNAKQLHLALFSFGEDYGQYPGDDSAASESDFSSFNGTTSNSVLGQLIKGKYVTSEEIFYVQGGGTTNKKPDNIISPDGKILEKGECGFAYIKNMSSSDNNGRPVLLAPYKGSYAFKPDPFGGKAIALRLDGAVKQYRLDSNNNAKLPGTTKTLFDTGSESVWDSDGLVSGNVLSPK